MFTPPRVLFLCCLLIGTVHRQAGAQEMLSLEEGLAIVTTSMGEVTLSTADGKPEKLELHAVKPLNAVEIRTGKDGYAFFSLSNGVALGIYKNSQVEFERFLQKPFPSSKESIDFEPSRSQLLIRLKSGSLTFSAEHLSPLSEVLVKLPMGEIAMLKTSGRVMNEEHRTQLTIIQGIISYSSPGAGKDNFITGPKSVTIGKTQGRLQGLVDLTEEAAPSEDLTRRLVKATHRAKDRVIFKVPSNEAAIPRPLLVADPEALRQPSPRPYGLRE